jgi:hypothetical protein
MTPNNRLCCVALGAAVVLGSASPSRVRAPRSPVTTVNLSMATLHAAALTSSSTGRESVDRPYVLVSIVGPGQESRTVALPADGQLQVRRDQAVGASPLTSMALSDGDTVRILISALEGGTATARNETQASAAAARALSAQKSAPMPAVAAALSPLMDRGAHWLGSATLLITRDTGTVVWGGLECVATCKVVSGGGATALAAFDASASAGVVELSGAGATYHMKLEARRAR